MSSCCLSFEFSTIAHRIRPNFGSPNVIFYITFSIYLLISFIHSVFSGSQLNIWSNIRALVVAPITEEIVFRSLTVPALYIALVAVPKTMLHVPSMVGLKNSIEYVDFAYTPWVVVCLNPFCFGLAHVHHLIEKLNSGANPVSAILSSLVQFTYTSIFGVIATLLLMRTNSVYAAILSHIVCNSVGLPDTSFMTKEGSRDTSHYSCLFQSRYIHLFIHAFGLVLFSCLILPCTSTSAVDSFFWE